MNDIPVAYDHQKKTTDFIVANSKCMITSDPGTGKTRAVLDAHTAIGGRTLVLAPLSILEAAWGEDIKKFQPNIKYGVAYAKNREKIFKETDLDMVITNFEAVNFLRKNTRYCKQFDTIVIDEFTAFAQSMEDLTKLKPGGIAPFLLGAIIKCNALLRYQIPAPFDTPEIKSRLKVIKTALLKARYYSVEERQQELDESYEALFIAYTAYLKRIEDFSLDLQEEQESNDVIDLSQ